MEEMKNGKHKSEDSFTCPDKDSCLILQYI